MDGSGIATAGSRRHVPIANHGIEAMHDAKKRCGARYCPRYSRKILIKPSMCMWYRMRSIMIVAWKQIDHPLPQGTVPHGAEVCRVQLHCSAFCGNLPH